MHFSTNRRRIAARRCIVPPASERTAKSHVTALLAKLGATDRAGAVAKGFDLGLLQPTRNKTTRT